MTKIFSVLQKALNIPLKKAIIKKKPEIYTNSAKSEYNNIRYLPLSTKIWWDSIYCYNKQYYPLLISNFTKLYHLFISYFNMLHYKINSFYKRRRRNKLRYSANKIYLSRPELEHTNSKVSIILHIFNKIKLSDMKIFIAMIYLASYKKAYSNNHVIYEQYCKNRIFHSLKSKYLAVKGWIAFWFKVKKTKTTTVLNHFYNKYIPVRHNKYIPVRHNKQKKKNLKLTKFFFSTIKLIHFNYLKFNGVRLNYEKLGFSYILCKLYKKITELWLIDQKAIFLNSDLFSSAIVLKLMDRTKKVVKILKKGIVKRTWIPDLHSLITFDYFNEIINKYNIINTIGQQMVSGVRFIASGRLTPRLTAMRAIVKVKYKGTLKNIRSSINNLPSALIKGFAKANLQYLQVDANTRNGAFGLTTFISSHNFIWNFFFYCNVIRTIFTNIYHTNPYIVYKNFKTTSLLFKLELNTAVNKKGKIYIYSFIILTLICCIPLFLHINIFNHVKGLFILIIFVNVIKFINSSNCLYSSNSLYTIEYTTIGAIFGYTDELIRSIVEQSIIANSLDCILLYIGLFLLLYYLTLNKPTVTWTKFINQFKEKWKTYILTALVIFGFFFFLINLLGYFGLFIINKSNFILFTLTVFTRIVFFKLVFLLLNYIITKKINLDLLSLNIITVLLIVGIVYCNVFIFYPLISSTMYLRYVSFYTTVDNKYNSIYTSVDNLYNSIYTTINNLCTKIENSSINYKNDLNIYIESCEKYTSRFYNFSKAFSNGMAKMSHLYNCIYSFSTFITKIECKQSIANLLEVNKFAFSLLQSSLSNLTLKSFSRENFNYIISELRNGHNRDTMVIGQQQESSVESSSKDLLKAKDLTMSMAYNGESSSSGRITRSLKRKLDHLSTEGDKNSDLDETKEKRKKRIAREDNKKQAKKYPDYRAKKQVEVAEKNHKEYLDYLKDARIPEGTERASKMDWKTGVKGKMAVWLEDPDGNKFHYISQSDAAKDLGVKPAQVSGARLANHKIECKLEKHNIHTEFKKKYRVHKLNRFDKDVTKEIANKITNTKRKGNTIYICDINNNNNIKEFTSLQQAADFLNTNSINLIKTYLGKGVGLKFKDKTYTVWRKNPVDFPEQLRKKIKIPIIKEHIAVSVTNSKGETTDYPNVAAACRSLGIEKYAKHIRRSHIDKESFKHGDESYSFKRK